MTKSKTESHTVLFKGRFTLRKDQINADIAFRLMTKCQRKPKSLVKTVMKVHDRGFHIGNPSGLVNIRKLWIYYKDIQNYYIFRNEPNGLVLVYKVHDKYFMCYFRFQQGIALKRICDQVEKLHPGEINSGYQSEHEENEIEFISSSNAEEASENQDKDENIDNFFSSMDEIDAFESKPTFAQDFQVQDFDEQDFHEQDFHEQDFQVQDFQVHEFQVPDFHVQNFQAQQKSDNNRTFHNSKIDNIFSSDYEDLFIGPLHNTYEELHRPCDSSDIIDGSVYLYSQGFAVPVYDIYGVCESDDEDA